MTARDNEPPQDPAIGSPRSGRLVRLAYSTRDLPPAEQFGAWRQHCLPVIEMLPLPGAPQGYAASAEVWQLGRFALSRVVADAAGYRRTAAMIRRDGMDLWALTIAVSGSHSFRSEGVETVIEPGVPHVLSLARSFEGQREDIDWLCLFVQRDALPEFSALHAARGPGLLDPAFGPVLVGTLQSLLARLPEMTQADLPQIEAAIAGLLAGCRVPPSRETAGARRQAEDARRERALAVIDAHLASPELGPDLTCKLTGMSRSHLYRCFEPFGGIARTIQMRRLQRAHDVLEQSGSTAEIGRTGEAVGFTDPSTFSRAFRRAFGYAPSELLARRAAGQQDAAATPPGTSRTGLANALRRR